MLKNRALVAVAGVCVITCLGLTGCDKNSGASAKSGENEAMCKAVKPGTVTTVNHYCVVMPDDPVNPEVTRDFKGQKVGFCCPGCLKKWDGMSDAQRSEALSVAIARGKPQ